jgi:hypothetical protein
MSASLIPVSSGGGGGSALDLAKRFVMFTVTAGTPAIAKASGVNSITDNGAGDFTLNFDALDDANYAVVMNGRALAGGGNVGWVGMENHDNVLRSTTQLRIYVLNSIVVNPSDWPINSVALFD